MKEDTNAGQTADTSNQNNSGQPVTTTTNKPVFDPSKYTDSTGVRSSNREIETKNDQG